MAASKITFADKVGIIAKQIRINQVWDDDVNEIKSKFNTNATLLDTNTTGITNNAADILDLQNNRAFKKNIVFKSANYNAIENDYIFSDATGGAFTITLPTAVGVIGEINITKTDNSSNTITINTFSSQTIIGELTQVITTQYDNVTLVSNGSNWFLK